MSEDQADVPRYGIVAGGLNPPVPPDLTDHIETQLRDEAARIAAEAQATVDKTILLRSLADTVVSLAADIGGHDARYRRPADRVTADNIAEQLLAVMNAKAVEMPSAFRQLSTPADMAKSAAVGRALANN